MRNQSPVTVAFFVRALASPTEADRARLKAAGPLTGSRRNPANGWIGVEGGHSRAGSPGL